MISSAMGDSCFLILKKVVIIDVVFEDPYQSPHSNPAAAPPAHPEQVSPVPKVFGIIHLVYGGLGGLMALLSFGTSKILELTSKPIIQQAEAAGKSPDAYLAAIDEVTKYSMIDGALKLILSVILIIAGINLIKYRLKGAKLSKIWAIARILVAIFVTIISSKASIAVSREQFALMGDEAASMGKMMESMATMGIVMGILTLSIYPIVTLIFMTRPKVIASLKN